LADEQALARVRLWWNTLDPATQMMFDKLYRSDPANVLAVISDGSLTDINGAATLSEALDYATGDLAEGQPSPYDDQKQSPIIIVEGGWVVVEPVAPAAGEAVSVRWTEKNDGAPSKGHLTTVAWYVDGQWVEPVQEVICGPMQTGESAQRSISLPGVAVGEHLVYVSANAEGNLDGSGTMTEQGMGMMASSMVTVGGGARPDSPQSANFQGISQAVGYLSSAMQAAQDVVSVRYAAQALYAFAGSLDTGGEARDASTGGIVQDDQASINVVQRAQALEGLDEARFVPGRRWEDELQAALEALSQAVADPWAGGQAAYEAVLRVGTSVLQG
jgi:hypothetical protein